MRPTRPILCIALCMLSACARPTAEPQFRSFDLEISHPSPHATFLRVAPGARGEDLPRPRQMTSKRFQTYFRDATGCGIDPARPIFAVGGKRVPAGYMVPIVCP